MEQMSDWNTHLIAAGARFFSDGSVEKFGDGPAESASVQSEALVVPLTTSGTISVTGEDAISFLNSQLTSDVPAASASRAQYSGYCTPKGRLLATVLLVVRDAGIELILPGELAKPIAERLRKYVLRAKASLEVTSDRNVLLGICGNGAAGVVETALSTGPLEESFAVHGDGDAMVVVLPGNRLLVSCGAVEAPAIWESLQARARPSGIAAWTLQGIRAGIATIRTATQEMFTPQMVSLDKCGGVSFDKGCYPGQEIVARTRYLGQVKRRLYRGSCAGPAFPGDNIVATADGKTVGTVTDAAAATPDLYEFLAVMQRDAASPDTGLRLASGVDVSNLAEVD